MTHDPRTRIRVALGCIVVATLLAASTAAQSSAPVSLLSFNIRYATDRDGDNRWAARRQMVYDLLRRQGADIIGVQEALDSQLTDLSRALAQYAIVGVGRDDGRASGEYAAILFRAGRFRLAQSGTFWFSDTPETVASRTWGNRIPRVCTWARFTGPNRLAFWVYNVHLDHESQPSRERSVQLLVERIRGRAYPQEPVIVMGDFNVGEDNPALEPLLGSGNSTAPFIDTFRRLHPDEETVGTFTGFQFGQTKGPKIDYILAEPSAEVVSAAILRHSRNRRYPSDHFPVAASVRLPVVAEK